MKYKILCGGSRHDLQSQVNKALDEGWQVTGGIAIECQSGEFPAYYQALTKSVEIVSSMHVVLPEQEKNA